MTTCSIVIDLGFGDAGKGLTTDYLASFNPESSLVVRFSGGHQVGHTVSLNGFTHTFSNFGSGTLRGVPTFYSSYCTLFPPAILLEGNFLKQYRPQIILDPLAMVTTAYDIAYNRAIEKVNQHGSCGLGFGATIMRNRNEVYFFAKDLAYSWVLENRLLSIKNYYLDLLKDKSSDLKSIFLQELEHYNDVEFSEACEKIKPFYTVKKFDQISNDYDHMIFEGSQGILLDTKHGIYPHTTWSNTTSLNAFEILKTYWESSNLDVNIYFVSRCYQTRHGNGPMSSNTAVKLIGNEAETNVTNKFQGDFRTAALDPQLLCYALDSDLADHPHITINKNLVITCLDHLPDFDISNLLKQLNHDFDTVLISKGPAATNIAPYG